MSNVLLGLRGLYSSSSILNAIESRPVGIATKSNRSRGDYARFVAEQIRTSCLFPVTDPRTGQIRLNPEVGRFPGGASRLGSSSRGDEAAIGAARCSAFGGAYESGYGQTPWILSGRESRRRQGYAREGYPTPADQEDPDR